MKFLLLFIIFIVSICSYGKTIRLNESNTVVLSGFISAESAVTIGNKLIKLNSIPKQEKNHIYLFINCEGGDAGEAFIAIMKLIRLSVRPIDTITIHAASSAFNIAQLTKGKRYIVYYGSMMTHHVANSRRFDISPNSLLRLARDVILFEPMYITIAERLKMTVTDYHNFMDLSPTINGENNLLIHTADEVVDITCSKELILTNLCPN